MSVGSTRLCYFYLYYYVFVCAYFSIHHVTFLTENAKREHYVDTQVQVLERTRWNEKTEKIKRTYSKKKALCYWICTSNW